MKTDRDCIFCKIVAGEIPCFKVYDDDRCIAFMDISPLNPGHLLVVPKEHFGNILEMDPGTYGHLAGVVCRLSKAVQAAVGPDGMNVLQLNGKAANQVVPHLHVHLVPRWHDDGIQISEWEPVPGDKDSIRSAADLITAKLAQ
ncbi:MAG: HIT family protein [Deltaproteobacteria bacterium]|nr:HIT family protein [Deltaproteobacteria bacterium]